MKCQIFHKIQKTSCRSVRWQYLETKSKWPRFLNVHTFTCNKIGSFFFYDREDHSSAVHTHLELHKQVIHSKCPNDQSFHLLVWLPTQSQSVWYSVQPKQFRWNKIRIKTLANSKDSPDPSACAACYCLGYSGPFV